NPSVLNVSEAQLVEAGGTKIVPPEGYAVTNIKPTTVELLGPIAPGKTKADMIVNAVSYNLEPIASDPSKPAIVEPTLGNLLTNPVGVASTILGFASLAASKDEGALGKVVRYEVGGAGQLLNWHVEAKNTINSIGKNEPSLFTPSAVLTVKNAIGDFRGNIPVISESLPYAPRTGEEKIGMTGVRVGSAVTVMAVAPAFAVATPALGVGVAKGVIFGEFLAPVISQGFKFYQGGGLLTGEEALQSAAEGGVMSLIGMTAVKAASSFMPKLATPLTGGASFTSKLAALGGRTVINASVDAGQAYIKSGGDYVETAKGVAFGAVFNLGFEGAGFVAPKIQAKIRESIPGQKAQEYLNQYYKFDAETGAQGLKLGVGEKVMMKMTGQTPQRPNLQVVGLPDVPTTKDWTTYKGIKEVDAEISLTNRKTGYQDVIKFKDTVETEFITEGFASDRGIKIQTMGGGALDNLESSAIAKIDDVDLPAMGVKAKLESGDVVRLKTLKS
ncbi:MAG: hypothetical protein WC325_08195, partial [Candidatus Bathyarchaeia archaeon]